MPEQLLSALIYIHSIIGFRRTFSPFVLFIEHIIGNKRDGKLATIM